MRTIDETLALLTGMPAGERLPDGSFPTGSFNGRVEAGLDALVERALSFAVRAEVAKAAMKAGSKRAGPKPSRP